MTQLKLFDPIHTLVQIKQKTIKDTPTEKLYDAFISLMAGAHGLVLFVLGVHYEISALIE